MDFVTLYPSIMHGCGISPESIDHVTISHFLNKNIYVGVWIYKKECASNTGSTKYDHVIISRPEHNMPISYQRNSIIHNIKQRPSNMNKVGYNDSTLPLDFTFSIICIIADKSLDTAVILGFTNHTISWFI